MEEVKANAGLKEGHFGPIKKRVNKIEDKILETLGYQEQETEIENDYEVH